MIDKNLKEVIHEWCQMKLGYLFMYAVFYIAFRIYSLIYWSSLVSNKLTYMLAIALKVTKILAPLCFRD